MQIHAINIAQTISDEKYNILFASVSKEKQAKIDKYCFDDDKKRTLYGDILVRFLACQALHIDNGKLIFSVGEQGKPFLVGYPNFHYNISHSGEWVVCAVSDSEIGIDIQQVKLIDFGIAKRFFTENEYDVLMKKPQNVQLDYFYTIWTLKESYIKCIGKGLSMPLNSFGFDLRSEEITLTSDCKVKHFFKQTDIGEYKIAVCSKKLEVIEKIEILDVCRIEF